MDLVVTNRSAVVRACVYDEIYAWVNRIRGSVKVNKLTV